MKMIKKALSLAAHPIEGLRKIRPFIRTRIYMAREKKDKGNQGKEFERLKSAIGRYPSLKLHIGCGPRVLKGWVNIDLSYANMGMSSGKKPESFPQDEIGDENDFFAMNILETGLPLPDDSVDVVFHEDFIEHLDQKEQFLFLAETFRVMKAGGVHRVNTPEILESMRKNSDFDRGLKGVYIGEWDRWTHKNVLSQLTLQEMALAVGYSKVNFTGKDGSCSPLIPEEHRPGKGQDEKTNLFADLIK